MRSLYTPNSEGSANVADNERKGRRKSNSRKVTVRQFKDHINTDTTWLNIATVSCETLGNLLEKQRQCIAKLDTLDAEQSKLAAKMSLPNLPRSTWQQLSVELGELEKRRNVVTTELREVTKYASSVEAAMKQNLELWCVEERKVTSCIEKSR